MTRITEEASATVTMNMEPARKSLNELKESIASCRDKLAQMMAEPEQKRDMKGIKDLEAKIAQLEKQEKSATEKLQNFRDTLKNLNAASFNQLYKASKELESQIKRLVPGSKEYIAASHDLQMVRTRIADLRKGWAAVSDEQQRARFSLKGIADGFNRYWTMFDTLTRTISGLSMTFRKSAEDAAKLDDVYADVMKTTGLLHEEVKGLDEELMKMDTRTSREQLLLLARDAGKLGITGKENILGFVRAADQIQVALGEDLGEGAIRNLGKIADVLGYTQSMGVEKSLLSIASAVNAVGQASTASESYLVDFTQRMAGVGQLAHLSAADIIGFASGLDQSAMKVEMSATAFQKFMMKLYSEPEKFAQYAHKSVSEFADLMKNDANAAMIEVLKGLREIGDMSELTKHFDEMGLDGARTVQVLGAMASNLNAVTDAQRLANEEFEKATSVSEEYATKNNNLQAQLEKARKEFHNASITLGQSLNPIMLKSTKLTTHLIKALVEYGKEIKTVVIVIAALIAALKIKVIWLKLVATWNATLKAGSYALAAAQALLAGNVTRAAAAWRVMNTAMKASVFGVVIAAISGLVIWMQRLNKETVQLTELQKFEKKLTEDVASATSNEAARVKALKAIVEDSNQAYQERKLALQELKRIVPDYHADLTEEGILINNNADALTNYINKMIQASKTKVLQDNLTENARKQNDEEQYLKKNAPAEFKDVLGEWRYSYTEAVELDNGQMGTITHWISSDCEAAIKRLKEYKDEEAIILQMIRDAGETILGDDPIVTNNNPNGNPDGGDDAYKTAIKNLEKAQREEENILKQSYLNREITAEDYQKSMREINLKYLEQRVLLARDFGEDETNAMRAWLDAQIAAVDLANKELDALFKQRDDWEKAQQEEFEKYLREFEKLQEEAQKVKDTLYPSAARARQMGEELAALKELHAAKLLSEEEYEKAVQQLRKKYADADLNEKLANVQNYIAKVNSLMSGASDFVTSLKEAETAKLEAEYQAQLTAAGDNAEKREEVETEYEQKQLDLKKKYADTEMAINIAKAVAAGASAIAEAYKTAEGNPYIFAALAALISASTATQIATIIAQRNAIKNASVYGGSTSGSSPMARTINDEGYAKGGFTEGRATVTTVGEEGVEFIAPNWMVRKHPVLFADLERYRKAGSHGRSGSVATGFAEGGFTGPAPTTPIVMSGGMSEETAKALISAIHNLCTNGVKAEMVYSEFRKFMQKDAAFRKEISQ